MPAFSEHPVWGNLDQHWEFHPAGPAWEVKLLLRGEAAARQGSASTARWCAWLGSAQAAPQPGSVAGSLLEPRREAGWGDLGGARAINLCVPIKSSAASRLPPRGQRRASLRAVIFGISSSSPPSGAQPELGAAGGERRGRRALLPEVRGAGRGAVVGGFLQGRGSGSQAWAPWASRQGAAPPVPVWAAGRSPPAASASASWGPALAGAGGAGRSRRSTPPPCG